MSTALSTFALIFVAELGDKTQLMAISLGHRYRLWPVLAGSFLAFALLNLLAVWVGAALYRFIPQPLILLAAGVLFLLFALHAWRHAGTVDGDAESRRTGAVRSVFLVSFAAFFIAELGDKTQIAMIALAAGSGDPWAVFTGGTLALWAVTAIAVGLGGALLTRLPARAVQRAAAVLFLVFGVAAVGGAAWDQFG